MIGMWNYRLVKTKPGEYTRIGIHEVYYDKENKPCAFTAEPIELYTYLELESSKAVDELKETLEAMRLALDKSVLDAETDFTGEM